MGLSALDRSLHISHGRKPVDKNGVEMPASEGAQDFIDFFISFAPPGLGIQGNRFTPGWCPGLHSYAAPRLRPLNSDNAG